MIRRFWKIARARTDWIALNECIAEESSTGVNARWRNAGKNGSRKAVKNRVAVWGVPFPRRIRFRPFSIGLLVPPFLRAVPGGSREGPGYPNTSMDNNDPAIHRSIDKLQYVWVSNLQLRNSQPISTTASTSTLIRSISHGASLNGDFNNDSTQF